MIDLVDDILEELVRRCRLPLGVDEEQVFDVLCNLVDHLEVHNLSESQCHGDVDDPCPGRVDAEPAGNLQVLQGAARFSQRHLENGAGGEVEFFELIGERQLKGEKEQGWCLRTPQALDAVAPKGIG